MRIWTAITLGFAVSACEFVQVQPVPLPVPVPMPATVRGSSSGNTSLPPTSQQVQAALGIMGSSEICSLLDDETYGNQALSEMKQRGDFTDFEIARIVRHELAEGMSEAAIRCAFGDPQSVLTRSSEDYDRVYRYRGSFDLPPSMWGGETRIYFLDGKVVDFRRVGPAGNGTGSQIRLVRN